MRNMFVIPLLRTPTMTVETDKNLARTDAGATVDSGNSHIVAASLLMQTDTRSMDLHKVLITLERRQ